MVLKVTSVAVPTGMSSGATDESSGQLSAPIPCSQNAMEASVLSLLRSSATSLGQAVRSVQAFVCGHQPQYGSLQQKWQMKGDGERGDEQSTHTHTHAHIHTLMHMHTHTRTHTHTHTHPHTHTRMYTPTRNPPPTSTHSRVGTLHLPRRDARATSCVLLTRVRCERVECIRLKDKQG